jgi:hypothetical protein
MQTKDNIETNLTLKKIDRNNFLINDFNKDFFLIS